MKHIPPQQLQTNSADHKSAEHVIHKPVLLEETVQLLAPRKGELYLDLTAGYGGHAGRIIDVIGADHATLVDRDRNAIEHLKPYGEDGARLMHSDFADAVTRLHKEKRQFDMVLVDLGVSSPQLDRAERGFSIKRDGPLDMRMDDRYSVTAEDLVNRTSEAGLANIIEKYGEESGRKAHQIARAIRLRRPLRSTSELAEAVLSTHRGSWSKIHPATRTFQAIRIALNDELSQIEQTLPLLPDLLRQGGRVVIISFHSLEDRIVKHYLSEQVESGYESKLRLLVKKPILGAKSTTVYNPRARSAILRAAVKK